MALGDAYIKSWQDNKDYTDKVAAEINSRILTVQDIQNLIIADNNSEQRWKSSVTNSTDLPNITGTEQQWSWLCIVVSEGMIYQRVAGASSNWQEYGKIGDGLDPLAVQQAIDNHNNSSSSHNDMRNLINVLDGSTVKTTGNQTIGGVKTFTSPVKVPTPINNEDAVNKITATAYVDNLRAEIELTINTISTQFRSDNNLDD